MDILHLSPGDELRCRRWHPLIQKHTSGTDATIRMLYFECRGLPYFGGFIGADTLHHTGRACRGGTLIAIKPAISAPITIIGAIRKSV